MNIETSLDLEKLMDELPTILSANFVINENGKKCLQIVTIYRTWEYVGWLRYDVKRFIEKNEKCKFDYEIEIISKYGML
ncbi:hypothetical protein [Mycoplasma sp. 'Moose RK']|uniref:hypothetical protein n=1 Tax=Mycoplasma sp. 'Moose RK' TaxID=2780095 RepID=UPI0018C23D3D|nr:hypothetical protein [Mycoplasma sp. 'Moose RK']MBG0731072.1 hypothetical protein [Mycoplasma sp. 'Moose RK']